MNTDLDVRAAGGLLKRLPTYSQIDGVLSKVGGPPSRSWPFEAFSVVLSPFEATSAVLKPSEAFSEGGGVLV